MNPTIGRDVSMLAPAPHPDVDALRATVYLLVQLRRANRRIDRLRSVALAATRGAGELETSLAALRPGDLGGDHA